MRFPIIACKGIELEKFSDISDLLKTRFSSLIFADNSAVPSSELLHDEGGDRAYDDMLEWVSVSL